MVEVIFLGVNDVGERIYEWLTTEADDATVLGLLTTKSQLSLIERVEPDLVVSAGFRHLVPESILNVPELGAVNCHLSHLPYNRGMNPNVWSIIEDDPAGVSIHYMDPKFDTGSIIDRRTVEVRPDDTGRTLYNRLVDAQVEQFKDAWPSIAAGDADTIEQAESDGTYHSKDEFVDLWKLDREEIVQVGPFLNRLRALTFPPFDNAYFTVDGTKYHVEVSIEPASETGVDGTDNIPAYDVE